LQPMSSRSRYNKIPPETVHIVRERPIGLRLGTRNGINYVYAVEKTPPPPPSSAFTNDANKSVLKGSTKLKQVTGGSGSNTTTTMQQLQYDKLLQLVGKRLIQVQELNVECMSLPQLATIIHTEALPMYLTFAEDIHIFEDLETQKFSPALHLRYFKQMITSPPAQYAAMDVQRMTLLFFSVFAVDLLCDLRHYYAATPALQRERQHIIEWVYAQQLVPHARTGNVYGGFRGGSFLGVPFSSSSSACKWDRVNMASTHNALCILIGLEDDLSRLHRGGILQTLRALQDESTGSFRSMIDGEIDLRFTYCACVVSHLLDDWSGVDVDKAAAFIASVQSYDGSLAFEAHLEGHGGSTFVGVAALILMNRLHLIDTAALLRWLLLNQGRGFKGRPEKPEDSCYSFWCGAVLSLLSSYKERVATEEEHGVGDGRVMALMDLQHFYHDETKQFYNFCNHRLNRIFNLYCQSGFGGFAKLPQVPYGDILHGYMGLAGLSMMAPHLSAHLSSFDEFPNLFKKKLFPITSCTVSHHDIVTNK